ncbi:hypothetical protein IHI24_000764 [Rickettsia endosymbiont of Cardiosporidium cionae]|nr:hypothetical protein IHI24_000764 [Rickettsia endosymbiont of Cardiosporidium cionae]
MEINIIIKAVVSLALVVLFMVIILKLVQKYSKFSTSMKGNKDLVIKNISHIDHNHKIVTICYQHSICYILVIGKNNMILIDKIEQK